MCNTVISTLYHRGRLLLVYFKMIVDYNVTIISLSFLFFCFWQKYNFSSVCVNAGYHIFIFQFVTCNICVIKYNFQLTLVNSSVNLFFSCTKHNKLHLLSNVIIIITSCILQHCLGTAQKVKWFILILKCIELIN